MSFPFFDQVQRSYNELKAEGEIVPTANQELVEEQKGLMTRRAAYYTSLIDSNYGILEKTTGNNSMGYSVDICINKDGTFYDIATDVEVGAGLREARPVNGGPSGPDASLIPRWRPATKALAGLENGEPEPPDPPDPPDDVCEEVLAVQRMMLAVLQNQQEQINQINAKCDQILEKLNSTTPGTGKFPILYPSYSFRDVFGRTQTMLPTPPTNP